VKKKILDVHETLMQLAARWTETETLMYEESKRIEHMLQEREQLTEEISQLKQQISKLKNQLSVSRSYAQTLKRQLDEASLRPPRSA
jgi:septal ring factor EnvC (AmiA/AmiB activator)